MQTERSKTIYYENLKLKRIRDWLQLCKFMYLGIFIPVTYENVRNTMI